jgi:hypothetical protein
VRRRAALAIAALVVTAGCSGGGSDGPAGTPAEGTKAPRPPSAEDQLKALLTRRARALQDHDARRYSATATGRQRAADREAARNARRLPLRNVRLTADEIVVDGRRALLRARSSYGIAGIRGHFEADRVLRAARTRSGWRIRSQTSRRQLHPWEVAPFAARRSAHFTVLAPVGLAVDDLTAALEDGYGQMSGIIAKGRLRRRYLVVLAGDARQARRMTTRIRGVETLAAISDTGVREEGAAERVAEVVSQRLVVVQPAFAELDDVGRARVVAHELTHAALAGQTSGRTPAWLAEGIALYVSGDRRVDEAADLVGAAAFGTGGSDPAARRALSLTGLSEPTAIGRLGGEGQVAAYAYSSAAAFYIVERFGREKFFALYDAFNEESLEGPPGPELTDRAVRRTLRISLPTLERAVREWIVTRAALPRP